MALRAPPDELFNWLERNAVRHVVLRDGHRLGEHTGLQDIDLLVEDEAIARLKNQFLGRRSGLKVDCYGVKGLHGSDYHGFPHLPQRMGEKILRDRRRVNDVWLPTPIDELNALLYHVVYHKNLQSGFDAFDPHLTVPGSYNERINELQRECGISLCPTHESFHHYLSNAGLAVSEARLLAYLEHDFRHGRKSLFHATLQNAHPGELNLFVIRNIAQKHGKAQELLEFLADKYLIITVKPINWWTRITKSTHMRGGKWRRGGRPRLAVVVFDPEPCASTREQRAIHPFVFNQNQFIKVQWREWFSRNTRARSKDNPIHSTDNEAEALSHLWLFFTVPERAVIVNQLQSCRSRVQK